MWPLDIYFLLWVIIQHDCILLFEFFQLWPSGAFPAGSCDPLTHSHQCVWLGMFLFSWEHFLTSWYYKMFRAHLIYFLPQS